MTDGYLRFADELVDPILEGVKTGTIRYGLERRIEPGTVIALRDEADDTFAYASVLLAHPIRLWDVPKLNVGGLRADGSGYDTPHELAKALGEHYPDAEIDGSTRLDLIVFEVIGEA